MSFIAKVCAGSCAERADVGAMLNCRDECRNGMAGVLEQIAAIELQWTLIHPHQRGGGGLGDSRWLLRRNDQIAAADVEFAIENQRDRQRREGLGQIAVPGDDALDVGGAAGGKHGNRVAGTNGARGDLAGKSAEGVIGAQRRAAPGNRNGRGVRLVRRRQRFEQARAAMGPSYQGMLGGIAMHDVVARQAR